MDKKVLEDKVTLAVKTFENVMLDVAKAVEEHGVDAVKQVEDANNTTKELKAKLLSFGTRLKKRHESVQDNMLKNFIEHFGIPENKL